MLISVNFKKSKFMPSEARQNFFEIYKKSIILVLIIIVQIFSLCLKYFPCVTAIFPVFSLSGKSKNQINCFPCVVATLKWSGSKINYFSDYSPNQWTGTWWHLADLQRSPLRWWWVSGTLPWQPGSGRYGWIAAPPWRPVRTVVLWLVPHPTCPTRLQSGYQSKST